MMPIQNAKDIPLAQQMNQLPNVNVAMRGWYQPMTIQVLYSTQVDGLTQSVASKTIQTHGVRQPFTAQQLAIKPEGERKWKWEMWHVDPDCVLKPDDIIVFLGTKYRVMEKLDYKEYGYLQYNIIEDYEAC